MYLMRDSEEGGMTLKLEKEFAASRRDEMSFVGSNIVKTIKY